MPANRAPPSTGAERQRAYRQRQKRGQIALPATSQIEPAKDEEEISLAQLNARMRQMAKQAFDEVGGVAYLRRVAAKNANTFLRFVGQFVVKEDTINPASFNIYVQQLTVESASPVPGVYGSPVAGDISPEPPMLAGPAIDVIEVQRDD